MLDLSNTVSPTTAFVRSYGTPHESLGHALHYGHSIRRTSQQQNSVSSILIKSHTRDQHNSMSTTYTNGFTLAYSIDQIQLTVSTLSYFLHCNYFSCSPSISRSTAVRLVRVGRAGIPSSALAFKHLICHLFLVHVAMWYCPHSEYGLGTCTRVHVWSIP